MYDWFLDCECFSTRFMPIDSCLKFSWDFSWDLNCLSRTPAWQRNNIYIMKYKNVKNWPFDPEQLVAIYKFKQPYVGRPALCDVRGSCLPKSRNKALELRWLHGETKKILVVQNLHRAFEIAFRYDRKRIHSFCKFLYSTHF